MLGITTVQPAPSGLGYSLSSSPVMHTMGLCWAQPDLGSQSLSLAWCCMYRCGRAWAHEPSGKPGHAMCWSTDPARTLRQTTLLPVQVLLEMVETQPCVLQFPRRRLSDNFIVRHHFGSFYWDKVSSVSSCPSSNVLLNRNLAPDCFNCNRFLKIPTAPSPSPPVRHVNGNSLAQRFAGLHEMWR